MGALAAAETSFFNFSSSSSSSLEGQLLPWAWVVEALAEFEAVDASVVSGVASAVGEFPPNSSWSRNARERLAFRHLQDSFATIDEASTSTSNIIISLSDRPQPLLLRLRKQMMAAVTATAEPELRRSDVSQFILQKRAILPKSALLQLKDQIGKAGQVSSKFMRKISGLDSGSHRDAKTQDAILPSAQRETNVCVGKENISGGCRENHLNAKRPSKNTKLASMLNNENSVGVNGLAHFQNKGKLPAAINEASKSSKDPTLQDCQQSAILVADTDSDDSTLPIAKRIKLSTNGTDPKANNLKMAENEAEILVVSSSEELHSNERVDRAGDHCTEPEATSTKASHLDRPSSSAPVEDMTNVAVKGSFFGFENVLNQDSDRTDRHFCIKCNGGGGQLLICSVNSCKLTVHESCVVSVASFDEAGKFSCPFCSLAQAIAAYCEVKRKVALVKEKVALARSGLFKFMSTAHAHREQSSENTSMEDLNQPKVVGDINDKNETDILQLKKKMSNQSISGRKHQQEMKVDINFANGSALHMGASISPSNEKKDVSHNREQIIADDNHQDARNFIIQEPLEPSTKSCDDFCRENEERAVINQETLEVSLRNNEMKMMENERPQSPATIGKETVQGVSTGTNANISCAGTSIDQDHASVEKQNAIPQLNEEPIKAHASVETENAVPGKNEVLVNAHVSVETENAVPRQNEEPAHGPPSVQNLGLAETSATESDDSTSFVFRRHQRRVIRHANQSSRHSRRQKIPWTTEEVAKLKEGVKRFKSTDGKNMPWKKILLYGQDVFLGSRTAMDLKDKWRNVWSKEGRRALD